MKKDLISQIAHHFYAHYMKTGGENEGWFPDGFTCNTPSGKQENFTYDECLKIMNCDGWRIWESEKMIQEKKDNERGNKQ